MFWNSGKCVNFWKLKPPANIYYMYCFPTNNPRRQKLPKLDLTFLTMYVIKYLKYPTMLKKKLIPHRSVRCSPIFNQGIAYVHQGRVLVKVPLRAYKVGFKFGMFAATKKPFNFRPKKLKNKR